MCMCMCTCTRKGVYLTEHALLISAPFLSTEQLPYLKCPLHTVLKLTPVAYGKGAPHALTLGHYDPVCLQGPRPFDKSRSVPLDPPNYSFQCAF